MEKTHSLSIYECWSRRLIFNVRKIGGMFSDRVFSEQHSNQQNRQFSGLTVVRCPGNV